MIDTKAVEGLDLAVSHGSIRSCMDGVMDTEFGADNLHMVGLEDHAVIVVDAFWFPVAL